MKPTVPPFEEVMIPDALNQIINDRERPIPANQLGRVAEVSGDQINKVKNWKSSLNMGGLRRLSRWLSREKSDLRLAYAFIDEQKWIIVPRRLLTATGTIAKAMKAMNTAMAHLIEAWDTGDDAALTVALAEMQDAQALFAAEVEGRLKTRGRR